MKFSTPLESYINKAYAVNRQEAQSLGRIKDDIHEEQTSMPHWYLLEMKCV